MRSCAFNKALALASPDLAGVAGTLKDSDSDSDDSNTSVDAAAGRAEGGCLASELAMLVVLLCFLSEREKGGFEAGEASMTSIEEAFLLSGTT